MITIINKSLHLLFNQDEVETQIPKDNCDVISFGEIIRITDKNSNIYEFNYQDVVQPAGISAEEIVEILKNYLIEFVSGNNNTTYTLIDCGTIVAPNENVLIDCGNFV